MLTVHDIDMDLLVAAMDGPDPEDLHWWINPRTGQVDMPGDGYGDLPTSEELDERGFVAVEPIGSHHGFRIMEDFISRLDDDGEAREALLAALGQDRPFRRFKDALFDHPSLQDQWCAFHDGRLRDHAIDWLRDAGLIEDAEARQALDEN